MAGAAQFVRDDRLEAVLTDAGSLRLLSDDEVAGIAAAAKRDSLPYDPETSTGQFSLAGAQAKFALRLLPDGAWALPSGAEPSTHIFKPAIPGLEDQDVAEVVTTRVAAHLGLPAAVISIAQFADERVVAIERYDRWRDDTGRWRRVHQEDLCQALGVDPRTKYESEGGPGAAACGAIIREHAGEADVQTFARAVIYSFLVKGSDAHARNYSLLLTPGDIRLAPLYDLNSTLPFGAAAEARNLAMSIGESAGSLRSAWGIGGCSPGRYASTRSGFLVSFGRWQRGFPKCSEKCARNRTLAASLIGRSRGSRIVASSGVRRLCARFAEAGARLSTARTSR